MLVGPGITAVGARLVLERYLVGGGKMLPDVGQLGRRIRLQSEVIDADPCTARRDREVDARVFDHPFGVVALEPRRRRGEQLAVEGDARLQIVDMGVNVEALHDLSSEWVVSSRTRPLPRRRSWRPGNSSR